MIEQTPKQEKSDVGRPIDKIKASESATQEQYVTEQYITPVSPDAFRIVMLHGDVTEHSIASVLNQMLYYASIDPTKPITLVVSTYGGSVDEMFSLYDLIKFLPCEVHTVGLGKIMSAGVLLLAAGTKGNRSIGKTSRVMLHSISGFAHGNVLQVQNMTDEMDRMQNLMVKCLLEETDISKKEMKKIMDAKHDFYVTPEQALKFGIVDKVISSETRDVSDE